MPGQDKPLRVIAWKDPTLEPGNSKLLAGYVITDSFWSAKALKLFDPIASREPEESIERPGWYGNGLHDVLFRPINKLRHRPGGVAHFVDVRADGRATAGREPTGASAIAILAEVVEPKRR